MAAKILGVIKFILFLLMVPLLIGMTVAFMMEISKLAPHEHRAFMFGILAYVIIHFFIFELGAVYQYGKKLVSDVFRFFEPLVKVAPLVLPIYTLILLIVFYFIRLLAKQAESAPYFLFFISLTFSMHMIFTARDLRSQDDMAFKPNYLFSMALVSAINVIFVALMLHLIFSSFSFVRFFQITSQVSAEIYRTSFHQLF